MHLVDTDGKGVERLTEHGVVVDGVEYEVDCLIFATGFEVGTTYTRRAGYDIIGRDGLTLSEKWAEGLRTLHGLQTNGFPNCFFLGFTQTAVTVSVPHALNEQAKHVTYILDEARAPGRRDDRGRPPTPSRSGWTRSRSGPPRRALLRGVHARLLQQRGQAREPERLLRRHLRRRTDPVLPAARRVALHGSATGARATLSERIGGLEMDTALGDMPIIDMDTHYNEPADLWTSRAPAKLRSGAPRIEQRPGAGPAWAVADGIALSLPGICVIRAEGSKALGTFSLMSPEEMSPAATEVGARLRMMDALGVAIQVVFPNVLGFAGAGIMRVKDPELRNFCVSAYNDGIAEMQASSGGRLFPQALLPF